MVMASSSRRDCAKFNLCVSGRTGADLFEEFLSLSEEERNHFIYLVIDKFTPSQLFHLDSRMEPNRHRDFIGDLPSELVENIIYNLDLATFVNCRLVCKKWNSVITSNPQLWKVACRKLGLSVKQPLFPEVVDYKTVFLRMRNRLRNMGNNGGILQIDTIEMEPICIHYYKGIVALGSERNICLWKLEPNLELLLKIDLLEKYLSLRIQFDECFLVAGTNTGRLLTWKLPSGQMLYSNLRHSHGICTLTFNKDKDLLVTIANCIIFWCLSSGLVLTSCDIEAQDIWLYPFRDILLHLVPTNELRNEHTDCIMLCTSGRYSYMFRFHSQRVSSTITYARLFDVCTNKTSSFVAGSFLYVMYSSQPYETTKLLKWDIHNSKMDRTIDMKADYYATLVGVGEKYACILKLQTQKLTQNLVVFDISTETKLATIGIPVLPKKSNYFEKQFHIGNSSWLNGFDGNNDKGVFLVSRGEHGVTNVIKWLP